MTAVAKAIAANQVCAACVAKSRDTDLTTALLARPVDCRHKPFAHRLSADGVCAIRRQFLSVIAPADGSAGMTDGGSGHAAASDHGSNQPEHWFSPFFLDCLGSSRPRGSGRADGANDCTSLSPVLVVRGPSAKQLFDLDQIAPVPHAHVKTAMSAPGHSRPMQSKPRAHVCPLLPVGSTDRRNTF